MGKMNVHRILNITVNILLLVMMVVLMISAMPISRTIFAFMHIQNSGKTFFDYLSIVGIYICGTYYVMKIALKQGEKAIEEQN